MQNLGTLTYTHLLKSGACLGQVDLFKKVFPQGFYPTEKNFEVAAKSGLNLHWAINKLLDEETSDEIHVRLYRWQLHNLNTGTNKPNVYYYDMIAKTWWNLIVEQTS